MTGLEPDLGSYSGYGQTNALLAKAGNGPEVANAWQQNKVLQQVSQQQQLQTGKQKLDALNGVVSSVMADPSPDNAMSRINDAIRMGVLSPQEGAQQLSTIASFGGDQGKIRQYAFQHAQAISSVQQQMDATYGQTSLTNNGGALVPTRTVQGPGAGVYGAGGNALPLQQSPGELAAPRSYTTPDGVTHQTTQRGYQQAVGEPAAGNTTVDWRRASREGVRMVNGQPVYGNAPPAGSAAAPAAAPPATGAMPGLAGPAPGVTGAADATAQAGAALGNQLTALADQATGRRATLSNLGADLSKIATGPNSEAINTMKAGANALSEIAGAPKIFDPQTIAASEQFRKNAQLLANQQQQALGGTDAALAAGQHSNPNLDLSTLGNKQVLATLQGNEDAIQVKNAEWQKWLAAGNSPATYPQFAAKLNQTFSPRAFQFAHMSPAERADMVKTMNQQDRAALAGALSTARTNGWINPGGQ